jgi:hypothetical protein
MKLLNALLWGYKNWEAADHSLRKFKQFYPEGDIFLTVDREGDIENYKNLQTKYLASLSHNNIQIGYPGNFHNHKANRDCWPKENTLLWLDNIYNACKQGDSKFLIVLEEDGFILKPISILDRDFGIAVLEYNSNQLPQILLDLVDQLGGNSNIPLGKWGPGYGASGAFIVDCQKWIASWEYFRPILELNYDTIEQHSHLIGWPDCVAQLVVMVGGFEVVVNKQWAQAWWNERPDLYPQYTHWSDYEIVDYLKDMDIIKQL